MVTQAADLARRRCVIDTDAANEIDDQFALAWALLERTRLDVVGVYAAPFSFEHRRQEMLRARRGDRELLRQHGARLEQLAQRGLTPESIAGWPLFAPPGDGMRRSFDEIVRVFGLLQLPHAGRVFAGSADYLAAPHRPQASDAQRHLIETALATPPGGPPLHVLVLGCPTNVASALLAAPEIAPRIVVVWTSGWPSHAPHVNFSLNLEQDLHASRVLFDSGVPLVYLPGFQVGAQLRLSLPEMERHVQPCGAIGAALHALYLDNPLRDFGGFDVHAPGFSWVIWDLICVAWLLDEAWVPCTTVPAPLLDDERRWQRRPDAHSMREGCAVTRDAIFGAFFAALDRSRTAELAP